MFVLRGENNISLHHIHCYDKVGCGFEQLLGFRDYLNENENIAIQYDKLKKALLKQYKDDRQQYTKAKAEFIQAVYNKIDASKSFTDSIICNDLNKHYRGIQL